jgi:hypothetical protein
MNLNFWVVGLILVFSISPHTYAGCSGGAIYDLVGWNPKTQEVLIRSLRLVSDNPEDVASEENVNEAVIVAAKIDFPYRFREISKFDFSAKLVGKRLYNGTDEAIQKLRHQGFESVKTKIVKPIGKVTASSIESKACANQGDCGELEFTDPLENGGRFVVHKRAISGKTKDVEHSLGYRDSKNTETVLKKSLFDKSGYARNGIAFPTNLVFGVPTSLECRGGAASPPLGQLS